MSKPRRAERRTTEYVPGIASPINRAANDPRLALAALQRSMNLAVIVRDEGADSIAQVLDVLSLQELYATVAVLAALVPDDVPHYQLLEWLVGPDEARDLREKAADKSSRRAALAAREAS